MLAVRERPLSTAIRAGGQVELFRIDPGFGGDVRVVQDGRGVQKPSAMVAGTRLSGRSGDNVWPREPRHPAVAL